MHLRDLALPASVIAHEHADAATMARAQARQVAQALDEAIALRGQATLVVSGGRSPVAFFECLAQQILPWAQVLVSLADERWVAPEQADSNQALVQRHLFQGPAAAARWLGLYQPGASLEEAAERADAALAALPRIDVLVLGMGNDGHTASLFPRSPQLALALQPDCPRRVLPMQAPSEPQARLSLTRPVLAAARLTLLAIQGPAKLQTLAQALQDGEIDNLPIRAFLRGGLQLHWCAADA